MIGFRISEEVMFLGAWVSWLKEGWSVWQGTNLDGSHNGEKEGTLGVGGNMEWCLGLIDLR